MERQGRQKDIIQKTEKHIHKILGNDVTGHDWWHTKRVRGTALRIAKQERKTGARVDLFVIHLAALLHDIADWKFHGGDEKIGPQKAMGWLKSLKVDDKTARQVGGIIKEVSFKGALTGDAASTIEGMIVQDADRLDALGAIGIARCFATGAKLGNMIHDPASRPAIRKTAQDYKKLRSTSVNHFYEKLFLLKGRMKTKTAMRLAAKKHKFMKIFIEQFLSEWDGETIT